MEITLSKKSVSRFFAFVVPLIVVGFVGWYVWSSGMLNPKPEFDPNSQPAMTALTDIFSNRGTDRAAWEDRVCANMTVDGCETFRSMFAQPLWSTPVPEGVFTAAYAKTVDTASDGTEVWEVNAVIGNVTDTIYIHVQKTETGAWLLVRLLFDQESEKYKK